MEGSAAALAAEYRKSGKNFDLILVTDMVNLGQFLALTRDITHDIPTAIYFHENQLLYPRKEDTEQGEEVSIDYHYAYINYMSMLVADCVLFNSKYHMTALLKALPDFLKIFPDARNLDGIKQIREKSQVLYLGLDLSQLDEFKVEKKNEASVILWNHRWEYDKNPEDFHHTVSKLKQKCHDFKLVLLGERFKQSPEILNDFPSDFSEELLFNGYSSSVKDYAAWLWEADILPVTSNQDFFGASVVEAIYCNTMPILPNKLAYPEHIPKKFHNKFLYDGDTQRLEKVEGILNLNEVEVFDELRSHVSRYDWKNVISEYDNTFSELVNKHSR
jgi:glycosyltransferase involved in cell wall biosynthesis